MQKVTLPAPCPCPLPLADPPWLGTPVLLVGLQLRFINDTLLDAIGVDSVPRVLVGNKIDLVGAR